MSRADRRRWISRGARNAGTATGKIEACGKIRELSESYVAEAKTIIAANSYDAVVVVRADDHGDGTAVHVSVVQRDGVAEMVGNNCPHIVQQLLRGPAEGNVWVLVAAFEDAVYAAADERWQDHDGLGRRE